MTDKIEPIKLDEDDIKILFLDRAFEDFTKGFSREAFEQMLKYNVSADEVINVCDQLLRRWTVKNGQAFWYEMGKKYNLPDGVKYKINFISMTIKRG